MVASKPQRTIIHVDMDAFFASIEQRDHPELAGKPVIVGSDPRKRGVVSAASYEARRYGVHSAMPIREAYRRCPHGVYLRPDMARYAAVSGELLSILHSFTPIVEPVSLDEAFLDVTGCPLAAEGDPLHIARSIKARVREALRLVASVGIAHNKLLAKLASDVSKPDGLLWVRPDEVEGFLAGLPVSRLWGVGEKTDAVLKSMGITTVGQLKLLSPDFLAERLGVAAGRALYALARGEDQRPVVPEARPKSVGREVTFDEDSRDLEMVRSVLVGLAESVARRARRDGVKGRTVVLKVRYADFATHTRSRTLASFTHSDRDVVAAALQLFDGEFATCAPRGGFRLVGVSLTNLVCAGDSMAGGTGGSQLVLPQFGGNPSGDVDGGGPPGPSSRAQTQGLDRAVDMIKDRFGEGAITRAAALQRPRRVAGVTGVKGVVPKETTGSR